MLKFYVTSCSFVQTKPVVEILFVEHHRRKSLFKYVTFGLLLIKSFYHSSQKLPFDFFVAIKLDWHPKYFHSAVMFLSLFYSDIHLLLKTLVLQKYNTGISIEAKLNWRSFLNPIVSVWSENVSWRVAVYRKLTNKGWPSPQLMVRQMR